MTKKNKGKLTEKKGFKLLLINTAFIVVITFILITAFFYTLPYMTQHNNIVTMPNLINQDASIAIQMLQNKGFVISTIDSSYNPKLPKLSIINQSPQAGELVKEGRDVFITINRPTPPLIEVPNLVGFSLQSAQQTLQNIGLNIGDVSYVTDISKGNVLQQTYQGNSIYQGALLPFASKISLVVGNGLGDSVMNVPNLIGMGLIQAQQYLLSLGISIGTVSFADSSNLVTPIDSTRAFISKQEPPPYLIDSLSNTQTRNTMNIGAPVNISIQEK